MELLTTERQKELLRVVQECFDNYEKRKQPYYALDGMSTAHIVLHAIADFVTLNAFWPRHLVDVNHGRTTYILEAQTMPAVQSSVRDCLQQLATKGYLEKMGNENERRWRLIKPKPKKQTKVALDPSNQPYGHFERWHDNDPWVFVADKVAAVKS